MIKWNNNNNNSYNKDKREKFITRWEYVVVTQQYTSLTNDTLITISFVCTLETICDKATPT